MLIQPHADGRTAWDGAPFVSSFFLVVFVFPHISGFPWVDTYFCLTWRITVSALCILSLFAKIDVWGSSSTITSRVSAIKLNKHQFFNGYLFFSFL